MTRFHIDASIRGGLEAFRDLGDVTTFDGYELKADPGLASDAEVLVTRSITPIGEALLSRCPHLLAVASPTIGTDHVDFGSLTRYRDATGRKVPWFHAPGATAGGVADFALAAMMEAAVPLDRPFSELTVGIWGYGNCGTALARRLDRFHVQWIAYDPPLEEKTGFRGACLKDLLSCDIISLHVPLTREDQSPWPTYHRVDAPLLRALSGRPRVLVNTSRGAVVDNVALLERLYSGGPLSACLDVWENEPTPSADLVGLCAVATPHSAGSVREGRDRSLFMVRDSLVDFLGLSKTPVASGKTDQRPVIGGDGRVQRFLDQVGVTGLSGRFKAAYGQADPANRGNVFDEIRVRAERHEVRWD